MSKDERSFSRKISKYRELILLLEAGALLHDIGKLSSFFIMSKAKGFNTKDFHGQIVFIDLGYPNSNTRIIGKKLEKLLLTPVCDLAGTDRFVKGIDLSISLSHFICAHHGCSRCLNPEGACKFKDKIDSHPLIALLKTVDHLDASNPQDSRKQGVFNVFRNNFFLPESRVDVRNLNKMRQHFYEELESQADLGITELNKSLKKLAREYFVESLSETRRFGNDIALLDHSESVAAYFKAYLFNYLIREVPFPRSFFDCRFRILKTLRTAGIEEKMSYELAISNSIFSDDKYTYFLFPPIRSRRFYDLLEQEVQQRVYISRPNDFAFAFSGTLNGKRLMLYYKKLSEFAIKKPGDILPSFTESDAVNKVKEIVYFALMRRKEKYARTLKSYMKHLENVKNGIHKSSENLNKYERKMQEARILEAKLKAKPSLEEIRKAFGWRTSKDAEKKVYDFFNLILSPIRPPSPVEMSSYFLKAYNRFRSFRKVYKELVEKRPVVLGRVLAYFRALKKFLNQDN